MYFLHAINSDSQTRLLKVLGQIAMILGDKKITCIKRMVPSSNLRRDAKYPESSTGFCLVQENTEALYQCNSRPLPLILNNHRFYLV